MRQHGEPGGAGEARVEADIDRFDNRRNIGCALAEPMQDRGFAAKPVPDQMLDVTGRIADRVAVAGQINRLGREASILHRLGKGAADIPTIVKAVYIGLDPRLTGAAGLSVLAHMEELVARGAVLTDGPASIAGTYRLADGLAGA